MLLGRWTGGFGPGASSERLKARGGAGQGITTTATTVTEPIGTGPPSSTITKNRGIKGPQVAGSSGGFIGLISGIAIFLLVTVLLGLYLYNRHRKRLSARAKHAGLPSLSSLGIGHPTSDPYDTPVPRFDGGPTPRAARLGGRPGYARQRSSEWELPAEPGTRGRIGRKGKESERSGVGLPDEPDEAAYPLRSRSPRPVSPRPVSPAGDQSVRNGHGLGQGRGSADTPEGQDKINPFDDPYDQSKLSLPTKVHTRPSEAGDEAGGRRSGNDDEDDSQTLRLSDEGDDGQTVRSYEEIDTVPR